MNSLNTTKVPENLTAHTNENSANQRAENLAVLGARNILELCVGPSLSCLEMAYGRFGLQVTGNDIDDRWKRYYPKGKWLIDDALNVNLEPYDTVIFAPPLSKGCSGTREDSLSIDQVNPGYYSFLDKVKKDNYDGLFVLVLPARSLATNQDRKQFYRLVNCIRDMGFTVEEYSLTNGKRNTRKYVDLYCRRSVIALSSF
jgi:hypothetical protein